MSLALILPVPYVPGVQGFFSDLRNFCGGHFIQIGLLQFVVYCLTVTKKVTPGCILILFDCLL
jgi:hypothetical protein